MILVVQIELKISLKGLTKFREFRTRIWLLFFELPKNEKKKRERGAGAKLQEEEIERQRGGARESEKTLGRSKAQVL